MSAPELRSRLSGLMPSPSDGDPDMVTVTEKPATLVQVTARKGKGAELAAAIARNFSLDLPVAGHFATAAGIVAHQSALKDGERLTIPQFA